MSVEKILAIIRRRRSEASDKQSFGSDAEEAQVWWRIMTEYDELIEEIESLKERPGVG
jgi:hypothetical protein